MIDIVFYDKICVMLPTYGRANTKLPVFLRSLFDKTDNIDNICVSFVVNKNDKDSVKCIDAMCKDVVEYEILTEDTTKCNMSYYFNLSYDNTRFKDRSTCVSMFGDDMVFVTKGWDSIMLNKINDKSGFGIVYGDDDNCQHADLCVHFITSRMYVEMTGKPFMCPEFGADWIDNIHMRTAKELGAAWYIPELHIRHDHFSKINSMDETTIRNRMVATEIHHKKVLVKPYSDEMIANIKNSLSMIDLRDLTFVMTSYDRVPILERMVRTWNKSVWVPDIMVYDDYSVRIKEVKEVVAKMKSAILVESNKHLGCDRKNIDAVATGIHNNSNAVVVLDSDTLFSETWLFEVYSLWVAIKDDSDYAGASMFNTDQHETISYIDKNTVEKKSIGGLGAIYKVGIIKELIASDSTDSWDNRINNIVASVGKKFLCSKKSYAQHGGYFSGMHTNDMKMGDYAEEFTGDIEPIRTIAVGSKRGPVLFSAMARLGDVVGASMVANMLIEKGIDLTWLVIPMYERLVERICPKAKIILSEPLVGGPQGEWSETNTYDMKQKYPTFEAHINAQVGARENHNEYMRSGLSPCEYIRMACSDVTGIDIGTNFRDYLIFDDNGIVPESGRDRIPEKLAIICPEAKTSPVFNDEMVEKLFSCLEKDGYSPRILVPLPPRGIPQKQIRSRYIHRKSIEQCICIIRKAEMFVGADSGMSWCALYSDCKKWIYHNPERIKKVNTYFSKIDKNAEDIIM